MAAPLKRLQAIHLQAMTLRLAGHTNAEIGERVRRSEGTIANWFSDPLFRDEFERLQAEAIERARAFLRNAAPDAAKRLHDLMYDEDSKAAVAATRDVLDRALGKPTQLLQHGGELAVEVSDARQRLADRLAILAERRGADAAPDGAE